MTKQRHLACTQSGVRPAPNTAFQAIDSLEGRSACMQAVTSLARRTQAMRPVALEVFMDPCASSAMHIRPDQACHAMRVLEVAGISVVCVLPNFEGRSCICHNL